MEYLQIYFVWILLFLKFGGLEGLFLSTLVEMSGEHEHHRWESKFRERFINFETYVNDIGHVQITGQVA